MNLCNNINNNNLDKPQEMSAYWTQGPEGGGREEKERDCWPPKLQQGHCFWCMSDL